jgi:hypothetical protein
LRFFISFGIKFDKNNKWSIIESVDRVGQIGEKTKGFSTNVPCQQKGKRDNKDNREFNQFINIREIERTPPESLPWFFHHREPNLLSLYFILLFENSI